MAGKTIGDDHASIHSKTCFGNDSVADHNSFITFVISFPGDFVTVSNHGSLSGGGKDAATVEALRVRYWLDQLVYVLAMIKGFPRAILAILEWSSSLGCHCHPDGLDTVTFRFGLVFMWVVSIPIGVYSATHQYSIGDNIFSFLGFLGLSIPDFLLSLIWLVVGTLVLGIPAYGLFSPEMADAPWSLAKFLDLLKHLWAPVIIMGIIGTAELIRIMRGSLLDVLNQQYVTTARAKGLHEKKVIKKYAVRMAINPLISVLGMQIPKMISSSIIVGLVLSIPTVGPIFLRSLISQDMYLAGVILLFMAVMLLVSNLLADLVLAWIDPRIRYE